jgi:tetratricopeptide (TPR) repeat protein
MAHLAIQQVLDRVEIAKGESDFEYFFSLLLAGEALFKLITLGMVAALGDDSERNRYRLEHKLVRADGLGDWGRALEDAITGPASQYLVADARGEQAEITKHCTSADWQHKAVSSLKAALDSLGIESEEVPAKSDLKRWFRLFVTLRNKTRGHGATSSSQASLAVEELHRSIEMICCNLALLQRPWADINRNYSGKYRVSSISGDGEPFQCLRTQSSFNYANGVYVYLGGFRKLSLLLAAPDLRDFFFANGGAGGKSYELISYLTDDKAEGDLSKYSIPPGVLPSSETEGHGELTVKGNCLSNVPDIIEDYVRRPALESELKALLLDDRRPIITLVGRGGIGKTSLSIKVIQELYTDSQYQAVIWLSARDVDLQFAGPKPVKPAVISIEDMGRLYASLVLSDSEIKVKGFNSRAFFESQLKANDVGACLYVFDNFETTQNPVDVFNWIDTYIRSPNKALITTRLRDFKGDYPLEVSGMEQSEALSLIEKTAKSLGISADITPAYIEQLIKHSEGHPYIIKILLGEYRRTGRAANIEKLLAGNDELLTALFERTYASLSPCAQRALLTLSAWNSSVPRIALEAVLMRSTAERREIESGVQALIDFSLAELHKAPSDDQDFIKLPLVATVFAFRKFNVSPLRASIQSDVEVLQMLGPSRSDDVHLGLAHKLEKLIGNVARRVENGESWDEYYPIIEMICRAYNIGWLILARLHLQSERKEDIDRARLELTRYLESQPDEESAAEAWRMLGNACYRLGDKLGEVHAFIERAQISSVPFYDVSNTANLLNVLLRDQSVMDREERKLHAQSLLLVMESRKQEASANDFSRMAWLALRTDQELKASELVKEGLLIDPDNAHCLSLASKLNGAN